MIKVNPCFRCKSCKKMHVFPPFLHKVKCVCGVEYTFDQLRTMIRHNPK